MRVQSFTIGDDKANWEAMWKAMQNSTSGRSGDGNIFDVILRANAQERGELFHSVHELAFVVAYNFVLFVESTCYFCYVGSIQDGS